MLLAFASLLTGILLHTSSFAVTDQVRASICYAAPAAPIITQPVDNSTADQQQVLVGGTADKDTTITVSDNSIIEASTTSDDTGTWGITATLSSGQNTLTATAHNPCGTSPASGQVVVTYTPPVVPSTPPPSTGSILPTSSGASTPLSFPPVISTSPPPSTNAQTNTSAPASQFGLTVARPPTATTDPSVMISGSTHIPARVSITINGKKIATTTSGADGQFEVLVPLRIGPNTLTITASNDGKQISATYSIDRKQKEGITGSIRNILRTLPPLLVHAIPYLLLLLIAMITLARTKRELKKYRVLRLLLERMRIMNTAKLSLVELASRYLRTTVTSMLTSSESLLNAPTNAKGVRSAQATLSSIRDKLETLTDGIYMTGPTPEKSAPSKSDLSYTPLLFSLCLVGTLCVLFDYLAIHVANISFGLIEILIQAAIYILFTVMLYTAFRHRYRRQQALRDTQEDMNEESRIIHARDVIIADIAADLQLDLQDIQGHITQLNNSKPEAQQIQENYRRLKKLLTDLTLISQLKGFKSDQPYVSTTAYELFSRIESDSEEKTRMRDISIQVKDDIPVDIQELELIRYVATSLIDNAISYSSLSNAIQVNAAIARTGLELTISDDNARMPDNQQLLLSQPFTDLDTIEALNHDDTSFSLYLDRVILLYLGGSITVSSREGNGTIVTVHIPSKNQNTPPSKQTTLVARTLTGIAITGLLLLSTAISTQYAHASNGAYGDGLYGSCTYGTCAITLTTSGTVSANILPSSGTTCTTSSDSVGILTDSSTGYTVTLGTATTSSLTNGGSSIPSVSGTQAAPSVLTANTWGYRVDGVGGFGSGPTSSSSNTSPSALKFAPVPVSPATADTIITSTGAADPTVTSNTWYGVCANSSTVSGTYTDAVTYTATQN